MSAPHYSSSLATLVSGAVTFHEAPVEIREKIAFSSSQLPGALCRLKLQLGLTEAVLLSTCNRVEYFGLTTQRELAARHWPAYLQDFHRLPDSPQKYCRHSTGRECVEHLFQLASGLESMVIGETEILGQIKEAYQVAHKQGLTQKRLNRLFQSSFAAAKEVRSTTQITRGSVSVGSVAVELAGKLFGNLQDRQVMLLGAGEISERTARSLQSRGVECLFVANRTYDKACELATQLCGEAVSWDSFDKRLVTVDIVICSTSAPHYVLTRERLAPLLKRRQGRPLFLIDLSVPRNIEPSANHLEEVYLYDIDDLQSIAHHNQGERRTEIERARTLLSPRIDHYLDWLEQQQKHALQPYSTASSNVQLTLA